MMRALKFVGAAVGAILVIIALLLVVGIPSGFLTSIIAARVERDTGYRLTIAGASRISLWPTLNVSLNDITLQDPKDRDGSSTVTIGRLQADVTLSSAWSGQPDISELVVTAPVLHVPLLRERHRQAPTAAKTSEAKTSEAKTSKAKTSEAKSAASADDAANVTIRRVTVTDGTIVFSNPRDRVENRIGSVNVDAVVNADRSVKLEGTARAGEHPFKFGIKAAMPAPPLGRQSIPVDLNFEMPDILAKPLTARAEMRLNGTLVMINGLSGTLDDGAFDGWASVDIASKPSVKLDLDFRRLGFATANAAAPGGPWSNAPLELNGLNYVDAQIKLSAGDVAIAGTRFAPAAIEATLAGGVLKAAVTDLGTYGGQASGEVIIDASSGNPNYAMHCDLAGVRALPLLQSLAGFDKLDGKMQAKIAVRSAAQPAHDHVQPQRHRLPQFPGRRHSGPQPRPHDPLADLGHAVGVAGDQRREHRPLPARRLVQRGARPGHHDRSQSGRPAGADDRNRHHRPRHQVAGLPGRAEAGDDHRGPGSRH